MPLYKIHDADSAHDIISDNDLARRLTAGDDSALNEIMQRYKERIYRFAWRNLGNEDTALDITQETFTKLYFNIGKFDPSYKFSTWLFQIALNLCRDYHRRNRKYAAETSIELLGSGGTGSWEKSGEDVYATIQSRQELTLLKRNLVFLPDKLKEAFILYALEDRSQNECAEILGVSAKTVETRVYRARRILAEKLGHDSEG